MNAPSPELRRVFPFSDLPIITFTDPPLLSYFTHGVTLAYRTFGNGPSPVLALHGFGRTGADFEVLAPALGKYHTIHAFDLHFHGMSPGYPERAEVPFTPHELAVFFAAFLDHIGSEKASLLGYSLGGRIAMSLLETMPERIEQVFLAAPDGLKPRPWYRGLAATSFGRWAYRRFVAPDIPKGGVDAFGLTAQVRDQILGLTERNSSLVGLLFWIGFRRKGVPYDRADREIGTSAWTFTKKWKYMQDSIFSFSDLPISLLLILGISGLTISILFGLLVFLNALFGNIDVPGYAATILVILFFSTLQLLFLGVLGIYLWRVFENTKGRPLHIVMSAQEFPAGPAAARPANAARAPAGGAQ